MPAESRELARVWLGYIERDLVSARELASVEPGNAAYHVQQAIEKALKSVVALNGLEPPRTHDLLRLVAIAGDDLTWSKTDAWLAAVSSWVATTRYPSDIAAPLPDREKVLEALASAEQLAAEVREKLA